MVTTPTYHRLRDAAKVGGHALAVMADLQGPKIRLGQFADGPHHWDTGDCVTITVQDVVGTKDRVSTTYQGLARDARPGDRLLIDDGKSDWSSPTSTVTTWCVR